jgi:DNA processing protein
MESRAYWIAFSLVKGIGAVRLKGLLAMFGNLEKAWNARAEDLREAGLSEKIIENVQRIRKGVDLDALLFNLDAKGIQAFTWEDAAYPRRLKEIDQPPPVLYVRGEILMEDEWAVAIVGTRRMTVYGRQVTEELARFLAQNKISVISGLAYGVDGVAHEAAMKAGGRTLAVLGSGVDVIYPPEHRRLADQMIHQGAIVSDYPPGTQPESMNFPPRNRIISGMSLAVVVVEASEKSGALITASFAADQGRDVFAVPGNINAPQSKGPNILIQNGARPLLKPVDVLEVLHLDMVQEHQALQRELPLEPGEGLLLQALSAEPLHIDEIQAVSGLPIQQVSATLALMELKGLVRQVGAMNYVLAREDRSVYRTEDDE